MRLVTMMSDILSYQTMNPDASLFLPTVSILSSLYPDKIGMVATGSDAKVRSPMVSFFPSWYPDKKAAVVTDSDGSLSCFSWYPILIGNLCRVPSSCES